MLKELNSFENRLELFIKTCPEMFPFSVSSKNEHVGICNNEILHVRNIDYLFDYFGAKKIEEFILFRKSLSPFVLFDLNFSLHRLPNRKEFLTYQVFLFRILTEKKFLESSYKIEIAAKEIGINRNYLSATISKCAGVSFTTIINIYRIAFAQYLISNDILIKINLEEIAFQCGFNNRTTFYRVFVEMVGKTPSIFRQEQNLDLIALPHKPIS